MARTRPTYALVAALTSAAFSFIQVMVLGLVRRSGCDALGASAGVVWLFGAGLSFAAQLACAARLVGFQQARRQVPWLAMSLGQPAILFGAVLLAVLLERARLIGVNRFGMAAMWLASASALALVAAVARRRTRRWSHGAFAAMTVASIAWAISFGTDLFRRTLPASDLGYLLAIGAWQLAFAPAYAFWAWPVEADAVVEAL